MWVRYDAHLIDLSLRDRRNLWTLLAGTILPTLHIYVLCKNWDLYGVCWEDCERKNLYIPATTEVEATISRMLKTAWDD